MVSIINFKTSDCMPSLMPAIVAKNGIIKIRKHNTIIASLKYLQKPADKIIPPFVLKVGSLQMGMGITFAYKTIQLVSYYFVYKQKKALEGVKK